jgi:hypothetical protein
MGGFIARAKDYSNIFGGIVSVDTRQDRMRCIQTYRATNTRVRATGVWEEQLKKIRVLEWALNSSSSYCGPVNSTKGARAVPGGRHS